MPTKLDLRSLGRGSSGICGEERLSARELPKRRRLGGGFRGVKRAEEKKAWGVKGSA